MLKHKTLAAALLATAGLLAAPVAFAHGAAPKHGGVLSTANDISFELVPAADGAVIHVEDHGKPLATQGMSGKLSVLQGSAKTEAALQPAGQNRLEAKGVKLASGAKAVAALTTADKKTVTVRFTVK